MAKKVVISDNELEPTVLYKIKKRGLGGLIRLVLLFGIFVGTVYYLPEISKYVDDYQKGKATLSIDEIINIFYKDNKKTTAQKVNTDDNEGNENTNKYTFNDETEISNSEIKINNFKLANKELSFDITNLKEQANDLKAKKYYLTAFTENDSVIKRIKVAEDTFAANEVKQYTYSIDSDTIAYFMFDELTADQYPSSEAVNEKDLTLICSKTGEMVMYYYTDSELTSIRNTIVVKKDDDKYDTKLTAYQTKLTSYNSIDGVDAQLENDDTMLTFSATIDISSTDFSKLDSVIYYPKGTKANIIIYEMESRDYSCK